MEEWRSAQGDVVVMVVVVIPVIGDGGGGGNDGGALLFFYFLKFILVWDDPCLEPARRMSATR